MWARVSGHPRDRQQPLHLRAHTTASRLPKAHALFAGQDLRQEDRRGHSESEERLSNAFLTTPECMHVVECRSCAFLQSHAELHSTQ